MKATLALLGFALAALLLASGQALAKVEMEESVRLTDLDEAVVIYFENLTGSDASSRRDYIDYYYDVDDYSGDNEVTQDEIEAYEEARMEYWLGKSYYYTMDGHYGEVDDCEVTVLGGLGATDSTALISARYEFDLDFKGVPDDDPHAFGREKAASATEDFDVYITFLNWTLIESASGLKGERLGNYTISGELQDDTDLVVVLTSDIDGDGYTYETDRFPADPAEWKDTDKDGHGDNSDKFLNDPKEWNDTDGDGMGDNTDKFPTDSSEWMDTDGDKAGDNSDVFPLNASESKDSDLDGVGDNTDKFPYYNKEWADSDKDGVGDNSDAFPKDPSASVDLDHDGRPEALNPGFSKNNTALLMDEPVAHVVEKEHPLQKTAYFLIAVLSLFLIVLIVLSIALMMAIRRRDRMIADLETGHGFGRGDAGRGTGRRRDEEGQDEEGEWGGREDDFRERPRHRNAPRRRRSRPGEGPRDNGPRRERRPERNARPKGVKTAPRKDRFEVDEDEY